MERKQVLVLAGYLAVSFTLGGCRQAGRLAWMADGRSVPTLVWPASWARPAALPGPAEQALARYLAGVLAESRGDLSEAKGWYQRAARQDPDSLELHLRLGVVQLKQNEFAAAIDTFEAAARMSPEDPRGHVLLGVLYTNQGEFEQAANHYAAVLHQDPSNLGAINQLADLYLLQEKLEEGVQAYERLLKERPDSAVAHFNIGVLYAKVDGWPQAVEHMAKAVELDPGYIEARLGLGVALELSGEAARAREEFLKALELEPYNAQLIHHLAQIAYERRDLEEAAEWLTRFLSFRPRDLTTQLELVYLRIEQGRWQEALARVEGLFSLQSREEVPVELWTALGLAHETGGQLDQARAAYQEALAVDPEATKPYLLLGALLHRMEQIEAAEKIFQEGLWRQPTDPDLLNGLGYLYADVGIHLDKAVVLIEQALAQEPENGAYLDSLGWAYFRMGRLEESRTLLEEAAQRLPDPEVFDHLGQVYLLLGRAGKAREAWEKGLQLPSNDVRRMELLKSRLEQLKRKDR